MLRIVLIDDSAAIRLSLSSLLLSIPDVEIAGCAADVVGACALMDSTRPDLVVLDVNLRNGENGIDVLRYATRHLLRTRVLILSNLVSPNLRQTFLDAGAFAYFDKAFEFMSARDMIADLARNPAR